MDVQLPAPEAGIMDADLQSHPSLLGPRSHQILSVPQGHQSLPASQGSVPQSAKPSDLGMQVTLQWFDTKEPIYTESHASATSPKHLPPSEDNVCFSVAVPNLISSTSESAPTSSTLSVGDKNPVPMQLISPSRFQRAHVIKTSITELITCSSRVPPSARALLSVQSKRSPRSNHLQQWANQLTRSDFRELDDFPWRPVTLPVPLLSPISRS